MLAVSNTYIYYKVIAEDADYPQDMTNVPVALYGYGGNCAPCTDAAQGAILSHAYYKVTGAREEMYGWLNPRKSCIFNAFDHYGCSVGCYYNAPPC